MGNLPILTEPQEVFNKEEAHDWNIIRAQVFAYINGYRTESRLLNNVWWVMSKLLCFDPLTIAARIDLEAFSSEYTEILKTFGFYNNLVVKGWRSRYIDVLENGLDILTYPVLAVRTYNSYINQPGTPTDAVGVSALLFTDVRNPFDQYPFAYSWGYENGDINFRPATFGYQPKRAEAELSRILGILGPEDKGCQIVYYTPIANNDS